MSESYTSVGKPYIEAKDKNGVKIYEGSKLKHTVCKCDMCKSIIQCEDFESIVVYDKQLLQYRLANGYPINTHTMTVVGYID